MMVLKTIPALLVAAALSLAAIDAASAGGFDFNVGPLFSPKIESALGDGVDIDSQTASSSAGGTLGGDSRAHVQLGCIDATRFPDFVNVPPTPCATGKWPTP